MMSGNLCQYTHAEIMVAYQEAINEELAHVLLAAREPDFWPRRRVRIRWSPQPLVGFRVVQENEHESSHWRMSEVRLFRNGQELSSSAEWRISADPRPWTARRAFDGNPVTAWNSWQPLRPGMRIQAQFPEARVLDEAELIYTWEQYFIKLNFFGQRPDGSWQPLDVESEETQREVSDAEMKAWVGEELKRHDVRLRVFPAGRHIWVREEPIEKGGHGIAYQYGVLDSPGQYKQRRRPTAADRDRSPCRNPIPIRALAALSLIPA